MWWRLWEYLHGPVEAMPLHERRDLWARLTELEAAADQLAALEQVERDRQEPEA